MAMLFPGDAEKMGTNNYKASQIKPISEKS